MTEHLLRSVQWRISLVMIKRLPHKPAMFHGLVLAAALAALVTVPAGAQTKPAKPVPAAQAKPTKPAPGGGPKSIGKFDDWEAAIHQESGQTACYAFTRAQSSSPAIEGRGKPVLTVTQRATLRDTVAIEAGYTFPANATVTLQVEQTGLDFYTSQRNAFARDGKAVIAAFGHGARAIARGPGPKTGQVTDTFSLKGFAAANAAVLKACPPK